MKPIPFKWGRGYYLTVDPGTKKCGWALWHSIGHPEKPLNLGQAKIWYVTSGLWRATGKDPWVRALSIAAQFEQLRYEQAQAGKIIRRIFIERPRNFGGSTGRGAAARNAGSVLKLMYLVGLLAGRGVSAGMEVSLVDVQRWKGNTPKEVTAKRVARAFRLDVSKMRSDQTDAIGIGDWLVRKHWRVPIAV